MSDIPVIELVGSEAWKGGYEEGDRLESRFPGQDAQDFAIACAYNGAPPLTGRSITDFVMVQQGAPDEDVWIWHVTLDDGTRWEAEGGCDYTGWDCQSYLDWTTVPSHAATVVASP